MPTNDGDKVAWLQNYVLKIPSRGMQVGLTAAQITDTEGRINSYLDDHTNLIGQRAALEAMTANVRNQEKVLLAFLRKQIGDAKRNAGYTEEAGRDMQVIGTPATIDPVEYKPQFTATSLPGSVLIVFTKGAAEGVNIYSRLNGQSAWKFVARDTNSPYNDCTPLAQPGTAEAREYAIRAVVKDAEVGQMSDIASVAYGG